MPWILLLAFFIGHLSTIYVPHGEVASGTVFHDANGNGIRETGEIGIEGVRVSNGREVIKTNSQGDWALPVNGQMSEFFVIKPRNWMPPVNSYGTPSYYYVHRPNGSPASKYRGSSPTGPLPKSIDFPLIKQMEGENLRVLMYGDPQPRNVVEIGWMTQDVVADCKDYDGDFGMALGDITFDNLNLFRPVASSLSSVGIPWWMVIGNHDINYDAPMDNLSNESFIASFGPVNYSFDWGPVHFLVLDDVHWILPDSGKGHYEARFSDDALSFAKNDLKFVPRDKLVVVAMHIPLRDVSNGKVLLDNLSGFDYSVSVSGHTHTQRVDELGEQHGWDKEEPHTHVVHVTACGSWWSGEIDAERGVPNSTLRDGTPKGWLEWTFDGNEWKFDFRSAGGSPDEQMHITLGDMTAEGKIPVWVNVWNGDTRNVVQMRSVGGETWLPLVRRIEKDPAYVALVADEEKRRKNRWRALPEPVKSTHLWFGEINPLADDALIEIKVIDRWGRVHVTQSK